MAKFCSNCGAQIQENVKFCASCGIAMPQTQQQVPPTQPSPEQQQTAPPQQQAPQSFVQPIVKPEQPVSQQSRNKIKLYAILGGLAILFVVLIAAIGLKWWLVIILTAVGVLLNFARFYFRGKMLAAKTWLCPACGVQFKIGEWHELIFTPTISRSYKIRIRCPQCNNLDWCKKVN